MSQLLPDKITIICEACPAVKNLMLTSEQRGSPPEQLREIINKNLIAAGWRVVHQKEGIQEICPKHLLRWEEPKEEPKLHKRDLDLCESFELGANGFAALRITPCSFGDGDGYWKIERYSLRLNTDYFVLMTIPAAIRELDKFDEEED